MSLAEVDRALADLAELAPGPPGRGRASDRYHARALLVPLGELLVASDGEPAAELRERIEGARTLPERLGRAWQAAVTLELELACAEHIHSVDPRFLDHPDYDWDYTLEARRKLTARLVAARELGLETPSALLARVEEADRRLDRHLG